MPTTRFADHGINCPACGSVFLPQWSFVSKKWTQYCDRACFLAFIRARSVERRTKVCAKCAETFVTTQRSVQRKNTQRYCSIRCARADSVGEKHPQWKGGTYVGRSYRFIKLSRPDGRKHTCAARSRGYLLEHVGKAEKVLGRCLRKGEVVHHVNGDKLDNRNTNLLICSQSYHAMLHHDMSLRYAQEKFGRK